MAKELSIFMRLAYHLIGEGDVSFLLIVKKAYDAGHNNMPLVDYKDLVGLDLSNVNGREKIFLRQYASEVGINDTLL